MGAVLIGASFALAFGTFIGYATWHPTTRVSRAVFWWSNQFGRGPADSRGMRLFGYSVAFFWIAVGLVVLASGFR